MIHRMENKNQGASKKKIKVRKPRISQSPEPSDTNLNYKEDYYIPIASNDSQWNGIKFTVPKDENIEHANCLTDIESEIKVIELENDERPPLLLLFPELKNEELNFQNILDQEISTTDLTKMLVGKKPNMALLKPCKKLNNKQWHLTSVTELSESDSSIPARRQTPSTIYYRRHSRDADESDINDSGEDLQYIDTFNKMKEP